MTSPVRRVVRKVRGMRRTSLDSFGVTLDEAAAAAVVRGVFADLFFNHKGRTAHKWLHYFDAYDEELAPYRHGFPIPGGGVRPLRVLEIGTSHGGSLQLLRKFFGNEAVLYAVDVDERCAVIDDPDLHVRIGSQADSAFLLRVVKEMGGVDLVIDDGSHVAKHQMSSFQTLFPVLENGGLYVVEDLHTSYWRDYGGAYRRGKGFIEVAKTLIDDMHGHYHRGGDRLGQGARENIPRIAFWDSMVFIRKTARARPMVTKVGSPSFASKSDYQGQCRPQLS